MQGVLDSILEGLGSGGTPMAHGMKLANDLLASSSSLYKLVILLSDGEPTPDSYTNTPVSTITEELCDFAFAQRILYSSIYLTVQNPPDDSGLLKEITRETDYVTDYLAPSEDPALYFRISEAGQIAGSYGALFNLFTARAVPQSVILREKVSPLLFVDPEAQVSFGGDGIAENQNILGFGSAAAAAGVTTLDGALQLFKQSGIFEIHLNELDGSASLQFSVKLRVEAVNPDEYPGEEVCVDVDDLSAIGSYITYLHPSGGSGSTEMTLPSPQARVCFKKGLCVRKLYDQGADGELVKIEFSNLDLHPVAWLEVAEYPSGFLNVKEIADDLEFKPFRRLFDGVISDWWYGQTWNWANAASPYRSKLGAMSAQALQLLLHNWKNTLRSTYSPLLKEEGTLDPLLSQFGFVELPPETAHLDDFWRTGHQRGIYRLTSLRPLTTKNLLFRIEDASYWQREGDAILSWHIDALYPKAGITYTMSFYFAAGMRNKKMVVPNPLHTQLVSSLRRPDLFTTTCFLDKDISKLKPLFAGPLPGNAWQMLDSVDIEPRWDPEQNAYGLRVRVRNGGGHASAETGLTVQSYFLLFTGSHEFLDPDNLTLTPIAPACAMASTEIGAIAAGGNQVVDFRYNQIHFMTTRAATVPVDLLRTARYILMINTVQIEPARDELLTGNNTAIEIIRIIREG